MNFCWNRWFVIALAAGLILPSNAALQSTVNYSDENLTVPEGGGVSSFNHPDVFNLMLSDCVISYTIDMSEIVQLNAGKTPFISVGMREVIESPDVWDNFIPGDVGVQPGGKGGWMLSLVGDTNSAGNVFDYNDKHQLQTSGLIEENAYDAELTSGSLSTGSPIGSAPPFNFGVWFDRKGVSNFIKNSWGYIKSVNWETNGVYNIKIHFHATSSTDGVMFATVNGMPQGFFPFVDRKPLHYPAGITFSGDMSQMQVFVGILGDPVDTSGSVEISNFSVSVYGKGEALTPTNPDITPPQIFLRGPSSIVVEKDSEMIKALDLSAFAIDDQDGAIEVVVEENDVNYSKSGLHTIQYAATDSAGNKTTAQRRVNVKNNAKLNGAITKGNYSTINFESPDGGGIDHLSMTDIFDLTQNDIRLSYKVDLKKITQTAPWRSVLVEMGLRDFAQEPTPLDNFNPGQFEVHPGGKGGWMISLIGDENTNSKIIDFNDKHNLQTSGNIDELAYNAMCIDGQLQVTDPLGIGIPFSYGIWFDRSNVDKTSRKLWGASRGDTYNTNGLYNISISYSATSDTQGVMFSTVNGVQQGFFPTFDGPPLLFPVGINFTADMNNLQVFAGLLSDPDFASGKVKISDINVEIHPKNSLVSEFCTSNLAVN